MKFYVSDIVPQLQRFSRKLDEGVLLKNHHWVAFNDVTSLKSTLIFRNDGELIISEKGIVSKSKWDNLGNDTLLIDSDQKSLLFKNSFFDDTILILNLHDTNTYVFLFNETKIGLSFKSIDQVNSYLELKYNDKITQRAFNLNNFTFIEQLPIVKFDFVLGNHTETEILFNDGKKGKIYKGTNSGKYFYLHNMLGITYCVGKEDCITKLYQHLHGKN
ncbi:hypothetical protein GWR56_04915 [Mucilaginibacter sp. 14171R-50]|uniref:hypothetical protein n=1 Tax=Mucilaginibacter sp. 14171R-50 TaxID=2703789 RepID=UPI00138D55D5|nr:hypothetical protein [Mucilaginibacter sp. 14171R-50]QHS54919.1 hypothetical protein GWR56_04915 [Mucilaginibacter sp. 14171R-50]